MRHQASISELIRGRTFDYRLQTEDALTLCNPYRPFCVQEHIDLVMRSTRSVLEGNVSANECIEHECSESSWSPNSDLFRKTGEAELKFRTCAKTATGGVIYDVSKGGASRRRNGVVL